MALRTPLLALGVALLAIGLPRPARADLAREREPNDTAASAQPVVAPLTLGGRIDPAGDVDLFAVRGEAGQAITADILARGFRAANGPGSTLSALLQIVTDSGQVLAQDHSLGDYDDPMVRVILPAAGRYFVLVRDLDPTVGGPSSRYLLSLEIDPNDLPVQATPVRAPAVVSLDALIDPPGDQDCYRVQGTAGQVLTADVDAAVFNPNAPTEIALTLYDPAFRVVAQDAWSTSVPVDPFVQVTIATTGAYTICVREVRGFVGTSNTLYQLSLDLGPAATNDTFATGSAAGAPGTVSGVVSPTGDRDLYRFALAAPASCLADLDAAQDLLSLLRGTLAMQNETTPIASDASLPDPALLVPLAAGSYAAAVSGDCSATGCLDADRYYALTIDGDTDGDGLRLPFDNCPLIANADQADRDHDGVGDACDLCPDLFNPDRNDGRRPPLEAAPSGLLFAAGSSTDLVWPGQADAWGYNVYRGRVPSGSSFAFSPVCLADNLTDTMLSDLDRPATGELLYYEVDAENQCAEGPLGADSRGQIRAIPPASLCPLRF